MSDHDDQTTPTQPPRSTGPEPKPRRAGRRSAILGAGALGILALAFAGGAAAWSGAQGQDAGFDVSMASTDIGDLADASSIGVTGQVDQIYGNKFVVTDGTSRALVETGRAGEGGKLVALGETVTVQGRFEDGFLHAGAIRHADQSIDELDPPPPGPGHGSGHGPHDTDRRDPI